MSTTYNTTLILKGSDGTTQQLEGTLAPVDNPSPPDPQPGACPPPGEDVFKLKPGQEVRLLDQPGKYDANGCPTVSQVAECYWPAPTAASRWIKFTADAMPDFSPLWPLPKFRTNTDGTRAPRVVMGSQGVRRLKARWADPAFADIVKQHKDKSDALSRALQYLATDDRGLVAGAVSDALGENYSLYTNWRQLYTDKAVFVLDWCYPVLTQQQRQQLVDKIKSNMGQRKTALDARWQLHEAHYSGYHAWVLNAIAVAGETGIDADITRQLARAMQHYVGWQNESAPDGIIVPYPYQAAQWALLPIAYGLSSDQNMRERALFIGHRAEAQLRLLSPDSKSAIGLPNDQACDETGFLQAAQRPAAQALQLYWIADYMRSDFAQYVAGKCKVASGWSHNANQDPQWTILPMMADDLTGEAPAQVALSNADASNVVLSRSSWRGPDNPDVVAVFCVGHSDQHDVPRGGHLQIWRGADELLSNGSNYMGSPSENKTEWESWSWSKNVPHFRPSSSSTPEKEGSQLLSCAWVDTAELYPNAIRLLYYASDSTRDSACALAAKLIDYRDDGAVLIATADLSRCYAPSHVSYCWRTLIHVRPGDFLLWDRWLCSGVAQVDARFFSRQEPSLGGIGCTIARGGSSASFTLLTGTTMSKFGGPGREMVIEGKDWICTPDLAPAQPHYCQDWLQTHSDHPPRIKRNLGQWVTTFRTEPGAKQLLLAIQAHASSDSPTAPQLTSTAEGFVVAIGGKHIHLPQGTRQPYVA